MPDITIASNQTDAIRGVTLRERAQLVLFTLGRTPAEITRAFHRMAQRHHPDTSRDDGRAFQLINEAHQLLHNGRISKNPLLADDDLVMQVAGRQVAPLLENQKDREKYARWHHARFHDGDWFYPEPSRRKPKRRIRR